MRAGLRSMTGYARVRRETRYGELTASIKSVNHRGLDLHFHLSADLEIFEPMIREMLRKRFARGHFDVRVQMAWTASAAAGALNRPLLNSFMAAFAEAAREHGLHGEPDLNAALRLPGMLREPEGASEEMRPEVAAVIESAIEVLDEFRRREGADTARVLRERTEIIATAIERLIAARERLLPAFQARLNERLKALLGTAGVDPQRLAQEAAILADKSDVSEELARLRIHADQLGEILRGGGETGKKIEFLLQEMNREVNTLLSKTAGTGEAGLQVTDAGLELRADLERIREQSLNLE